MFSRPPAPAAKVTTMPDSPLTVISQNLKVTGTLETDGDVQIDGAIEGDIRCSKISIGQSGRVKGSIIPDSLTIHGAAEGKLEARSISISASANVSGDIVHESVAIEPGARVEGNFARMKSSSGVRRGDASVFGDEIRSSVLGADSTGDL